MMGDKDKIPIGTELQLGHSSNDPISRRGFISILSNFGIGVVGLTKLIQRAYGKEPEGAPLVLTYDIYGRPDHVKIIPEESHRRVSVFSNFPMERFVNNYPFLNKVKLFSEGSEPEDIKLKFLIDEVSRSKQRNIPNKFKGVPVIVEEFECERHDDACDENTGTFDPLVGNVGLWNDDIGVGTLSFVGYNSSNEELVTAAHVVTDSDGNPISEIKQGNRVVGTLSSYDSDHDVASYTIKSSVSASSREFNNDSLKRLQGAWSHSGLGYEINQNGNTIPSRMSGRTTCFTTNECNDVSYDANLKHECAFKYRNASGGDSGAAWVDPAGYLVGVHSGWSSWWNDKWDYACPGQEALDNLGMSLYTN